jgi:hypothetical protein
MKRFLIVALLAFAAWKGFGEYQNVHTANAASPAISEPILMPALSALSSPFKCDGRTHCSQMTSCAEAAYFLRNCPDVKMDGNNDGVPCEQQWCN